MATMASFFPGGSSVWETKVWQMLAEACATQADRNSMSYGAGEPFADATDLTLTNAVVESGYCRNTVTAGTAGGDAIPVMTAATTDGVTMSADTDYGTTYAAWKASDSTTATKWLSAESALPHWLKVAFASATRITGYTITHITAGGESHPASWRLEGSSDNVNWTTLDTQTSQSFVSGTKRTFTLASTASYQYYRLYITGAANSLVHVDDFELLGEGTPGSVNAATINLAPITLKVPVGREIVAAVLDTSSIGIMRSTSTNTALQTIVNTTQANWTGVAVTPSGDVYACIMGDGIYKQTAGIGSFVGLSQTYRSWMAMCSDREGNVYACDYGGDIYKQTRGTGNFVALSQTSRNWRGICCAPNGDIYATVTGGDIYVQTGGSGNFVALSQTTRNWYGIAAAPNGDVYACVDSGDIYKQTGGSGNFVALGQTTRNWFGLCVTSDGVLHASVNGGHIYKMVAGTMTQQTTTSRTYRHLASAPHGGTIPDADVADAGRIVFTGYNADASEILDVGNSGSNKIEVSATIDGTAGSALAVTSESLGSNKWRFTTGDIDLSTATTFGVQIKSYARTTAPNFRIYEALMVWR